MLEQLKGKLAKVVLVLLASVMLTVIAPLSAMAATTADVAVTADPTYIAITNTPNSWAIGAVMAGIRKNSGATYFTANNSGNTASNISIQAILVSGNWSGGQGWIHSNTATAGSNTVGLIAGTTGWTSNVTVKSTADWLTTGLAAATTYPWGMELVSPSDITDGAQKSMTVRLAIYQQ